MSTEITPGAADYTSGNLRMYDLFVLGFSARFVWKCPTKDLLAQYDRNVGRHHLDVGVGSGYFLDNCRFPEGARVELLDLQPDSLAYTSKRIARYQPVLHRGDILQPLALEGEPFDSIGINYLLHCLPGPMKHKATAFDHLRAHLEDDGVLFGATVLGDQLACSWLGTRLCAHYNKIGWFDNLQDTLPDLRAELEARFAQVKIQVTGCVAVFEARQPRR